MSLRLINLDYYETQMIGYESRISTHRSIGLYLDVESNPIFDLSGDKYPYSTTRGDDGYKDEYLDGKGPLNIFDYENPKIITKRTGRFTILFILGNILTGHGTHIQAPFLDNFFEAMSVFFNHKINIFNCDDFLPLLVGNILVSPWNQWIYPGMGIYVGPDGNEMSIRKNDGTLKRFKRHNKRIVSINNVNSYMMNLYPPK